MPFKRAISQASQAVPGVWLHALRATISRVVAQTRVGLLIDPPARRPANKDAFQSPGSLLSQRAEKLSELGSEK